MEFCNGSIWAMLGGNVGCSINFPAITNADLNTLYDTTDAIYSAESAAASVVGATLATIRRNGTNTGMSSGVTINQGNSVGIRGRSASLFNQTANFTLDIGAYTACWQITTKQQDVTPNAFSFISLTNQELNALVTSNSVNVNGFDGPLTVSVSGQGNPQIKIGSGSWVTSGEINPGQSLMVRLTASASFETAYLATVALGSYSASWSVTTRANCTPGSQTYSASGNYTLPIQAGCSTVTVKLWGAGGGQGTNGPDGGTGAYVFGPLPGAPGKTLQIAIGGAGQSGSGGFNGGGNGGSGIGRSGGGGGGATTIKIDGLYVAAAAGGGGGGAWSDWGQSASTDIVLPANFGLSGGNGANGYGAADDGCNAGGGGGGGGGQGGQRGSCNNGETGGHQGGGAGKSIVPAGGSISILNTSDPSYNGSAGKARQPGMAHIAWSN